MIVVKVREPYEAPEVEVLNVNMEVSIMSRQIGDVPVNGDDEY